MAGSTALNREGGAVAGIGNGTVFALNTDGSGFSVLLTLNASGVAVFWPEGRLLQA